MMPPTSGTTEPALANRDPADCYRELDRRLVILETRFDIILPTLATKLDLLSLKTELTTAFKAEMQTMQKWIMATLISMFIGFGGLIIALLTLPRPT
jgi:hypothetical protein